MHLAQGQLESLICSAANGPPLCSYHRLTSSVHIYGEDGDKRIAAAAQVDPDKYAHQTVRRQGRWDRRLRLAPSRSICLRLGSRSGQSHHKVPCPPQSCFFFVILTFMAGMWTMPCSESKCFDITAWNHTSYSTAIISPQSSGPKTRAHQNAQNTSPQACATTPKDNPPKPQSNSKNALMSLPKWHIVLSSPYDARG